jgi:hypothetical protein
MAGSLGRGPHLRNLCQPGGETGSHTAESRPISRDNELVEIADHVCAVLL